MGRLPKAPFEKILKDSSKNIRVADAAAAELTAAIEEMSISIAENAAELARHARRRTILKEDVALAVRRR